MKSLNNFLILLTLILVYLSAVAGDSFGAPRADDLLKRKSFDWKSATTEHLRIHYESGSFAETRIEGLKILEEKAFVRNQGLLQADYTSNTDIFIVASRERMKLLIGSESNGIAYPDTQVVCFVFSEKIDASGSHELMHVMARNAWAGKPKTWINEGFATYSDGIWYGFKLHDLNKYLLQKQKLVPLDKLTEDYRDQPEMIAYPQSGSFVKYLYEEYGVEKFRELWNSGTLKGLRRVLGKDSIELEKEWQARLMKADGTNVNLNF